MSLSSQGLAITFSDWQLEHFTLAERADPEVSGGNADPDGDGMRNLAEYAFGGDPWDVEPASPTEVSLVEGHFHFAYPHRMTATDLSYHFESSMTLMDESWSLRNDPVLVGPPVVDGDFEWRTLLDPVDVSGLNRLFLRMRIFNAASTLEIRETPTGVEAKQQESNPAIDILWVDRSNVESGYQIERRTGAGTWQWLTTTASDVFYYSDATAVWGSDYSYRLRADYGDSFSDYSTVISATTYPDTDSDGIPDHLELGYAYEGVPGTYATFPDQYSSGGSGMPDGWLIMHGLDPFNAAPDSDEDNDGLSLFDEFLLGTNPSNPDTDGDGLLDGEEAVPTVAQMQRPAAPRTNYLLIDLGEVSTVGHAQGINDAGEVLLVKQQVHTGIKAATLWSGGQHYTFFNSVAGTFFGPLQDGTVYFSADAEFESERMDDREENAGWYRHWGSERLKKVQAGEAVSESGLASSYAGSGGFGVHIPSPPVTGSRNPPLSSAAKAALDSQYAQARQVYDSYAQGAANEQWLNEFREGSTATVIGFNDLHTQVFEGRSTLWVWADSAHQPQGTFSAWVEAQVVGWGENIFPTFRKTMYSVVDGSSGGMFPETHPWETFHSSESQAHGEPLADIKVNNEGAAIYHKLFDEYTQWGTQVTRREGMIKIGAAPEAIPGAKSVADLNEKLASPEGPYMVGTKGENQPTMWCYNNGQFASIDLGESTLSGGSRMPGRTISNRLEIPLGDRLWRNSRLHDLADLCGNPAEWSQIRAFTISPNTGILSGSALKDTNNDGQFHSSPYNDNGPDKLHAVLLLPFEVAPEVLRVNADFDEQKIDSSTGFAQPDRADECLIADSGPDAGKIIVIDLHKGFFGVNPNTLPADFYTGATVTIEKLAEGDPETSQPELGEVRFYATKNQGESGEQFWPIPITEPASGGGTTPKNLVPVIYAENATVPRGTDVQFWIEGIKAGPITLEFKYIKGALTFSHKQKFLVATHQSKAEWQQEIIEQIKLQTQATGVVDFALYHPPWPAAPFMTNKAYVQQVYIYYEYLYRQQPKLFLWAGLAKMAGGPVSRCEVRRMQK